MFRVRIVCFRLIPHSVSYIESKTFVAVFILCAIISRTGNILKVCLSEIL